MARLSDKITLVTGATRGAGRGIATALGAEGATVYVTGRTVRGKPVVAEFPHGVEDTAEEVTAAGGRGVAVACDHTNDDDVRALFDRIRAEHGRLDVLVANAWGGYMPYPEHTTFTRGRRYLGNVFYDVAKNAVCRLVAALAEETKDTDLAIVGVSPGWMAVERMTGLSERQRAEMETVTYIGRAITALACDPAVSRRSGQTLAVGDLARIYGFTDIDGRQPTPYVIES
jgi:NAD(P)-dependent dehydrogenase (short-subunit alcohol dehydrogenase family)